MTFKTTYYCDCKTVDSISNPVIDNNVGMKYGGFLSESWNYLDRGFNYGIRKDRSNQGFIFCEDASKLFSSSNGSVGITIRLPFSIVNGIYEPLTQTTDIDEYLLWGVNVGEKDVGFPSVYLKFTRQGIEFTLWGSAGKFTILGNSTIPANQDIWIKCSWNNDYSDPSIIGFDKKMELRINEDVFEGNPPSNNDDFSGLNFYLLDTPRVDGNLECILKKISVEASDGIVVTIVIDPCSWISNSPIPDHTVYAPGKIFTMIMRPINGCSETVWCNCSSSIVCWKGFPPGDIQLITGALAKWKSDGMYLGFYSRYNVNDPTNPLSYWYEFTAGFSGDWTHKIGQIMYGTFSSGIKVASNYYNNYAVSTQTITVSPGVI